MLELIDHVINEDTAYARQPLELRNQRIYAVKSGINGLLDVARTTYKEASEDAYQHSTELSGKSRSTRQWALSHTYTEGHDIQLDLKYENGRQFYIRISKAELEGKPLPPVFTNIIRRKNFIECQTLELMKRNQKVVVLSVEYLSADSSRSMSPTKRSFL